jgi:hypothetical protein
MFNVVYLDDRQGDEPIQLQPKEQKPFDINEAFDFSKISDGTQQPSDDGYSEQQTTGSDGEASSGSNIGEAIAEVLLQPNVAPTSGGGGGGASGGWRNDDDDDEKNKHSYDDCTSSKRSMFCYVSLPGLIKNGQTRQTISSSFTPMKRNIKVIFHGFERVGANDGQKDV